MKGGLDGAAAERRCRQGRTPADRQMIGENFGSGRACTAEAAEGGGEPVADVDRCRAELLLRERGTPGDRGVGPEVSGDDSPEVRRLPLLFPDVEGRFVLGFDADNAGDPDLLFGGSTRSWLFRNDGRGFCKSRVRRKSK